MDKKVSGASFRTVENMHAFVEQSVAKFRYKTDERLKVLKTNINNLINELYELILNCAFTSENHRVPVHGIPYPSFENPVNLF